MPRLSETLHEAQTNGLPLICKNCSESTAARACSVSTDCDEVFCSDGCRDTYEAAYFAYIAREQEAAAARFKTQTAADRTRWAEYNAWAAQVSAA